MKSSGQHQNLIEFDYNSAKCVLQSPPDGGLQRRDAFCAPNIKNSHPKTWFWYVRQVMPKCDETQQVNGVFWRGCRLPKSLLNCGTIVRPMREHFASAEGLLRVSSGNTIYRCANTVHHRLNYEKFCFNIRIKANLAKIQVKLYYNQPHTVAWSITVLLIATTATSDDKVWRDEQNCLRCLECKMSKSALSAEKTVHQKQQHCSLAAND